MEQIVPDPSQLTPGEPPGLSRRSFALGDPRRGDERGGEPRGSQGGWMYWLLIAMAAAVFAPCVLLPVWREYQALKYAEQVEQAAVEQARDDLYALHRNLNALQNDPAVISRLARRDLRYAAHGETVVPVSLIDEPPDEPAAAPLQPVQPPVPLARLLDKLPEADYDRLFCHGQTRTILMCLAGGLVLAAMAIFPVNKTA